MNGSNAIRVALIAVIALATIGLAGDPASGAKANLRERADRPAIRTGDWRGEPDAWAKAHRRHVARAQEADADVVFLGDSITHAWGDDTRDDMGNAAWLAEFGPLRAANFGFPGDQTQHLLHRVEDGELQGHPRVAVVLIGTNNLTEGQSAEETASGVAAVVDAIHEASPTTRVLLLGLLPREFEPEAPLRQEAVRVNAILRGWARAAEVDFLDAGGGFLDPDGRLKLETSQDGVHPTSEGYRLLARSIAQPLRKLLRAG